MKKNLLIVLVLLLFSGCANKSLYQFKNVKINNETVNIPIKVGEFVQKEGLTLDDADNLEKHSSMIIELDNYSIIIENDTNKDIAITDASIIGFRQDNNAHKDDIITFPEKLHAGQNIDPDSVMKMLTSSGDIKGDVGCIINDDKTEYKIIAGERIVNLLGDLKEESEKVIYPVEITIRYNVITNIQMIFK